MLHFFMRLVIL